MSRCAVVCGVAIAAATGCLESDSVPCGGGLVCAQGTVCASVTDPDETLCATPEQIEVCAGRAGHARCLDGGRCYDGVCLPVECGNGRLDSADPADPADLGEACDDGNRVDRDGCSSDCRSNETCGNGVTDTGGGELCDDANFVDHDGCDSRCRAEQPSWHQLDFGPPSQRERFAMAYDAGRGRVVLFGGLEGAPLGDTWEWNGVGWSRAETQFGPAPRTDAAMVYDAATDRIVLFGGNSTAPFQDTWEWDGRDWAPRAVSVSPPARAGHAMAYDSARGRVVLFGGTSFGLSDRLLDDTWEWDGTSWTEIDPPSRPGPNSHSAMVYDPSRGVTVLFGGLSSAVGELTPPVWEYDGSTWRALNPAGAAPVPRHNHVMAWDSAGRRVLLFGGIDRDDVALADTWAWNGETWEVIEAASAPQGRGGHGAVADTQRGRVVMWGGTKIPDVELSLATWEWDGATWNQSFGNPPTNGSAAGVYDARRGRSVVFIQSSILSGSATLFEFDGRTWQQRDLPVEVNGTSFALAYDEARSQTVLFTGGNAQTWLWDGAGWTHVASRASPSPSFRVVPALAYDAARARVVLFGGVTTDNIALDDTWEWDGRSWTELRPRVRPDARGGHALAYDPIRRQLVLHGGSDRNRVYADTWTWDGVTWVRAADAGPLRQRGALTFSAARRAVVLFGGTDDSGAPTSDAWEWDGTAWTLIPAFSAPPGRFGHALVPARGGGLLVFGGQFSLSDILADSWLLDWRSDDPVDSCRDELDRDGDGLAGCADLDCWQECTPLCPPGTSCGMSEPGCGDSICDAQLETCQLCPADCACPAICGDFICAPDESLTACPGDCAE